MGKYDTLNPEQREAVFATEGPLLVLAGAGSGKTRVLTHRIAYLIEEKHVEPWHILAITFTNKAAGEMRERVDNIVGFGADQVWVSTFHSMCVRILRRFIDNLGFSNSFSIYDTDDQKTLMKEVFKNCRVDPKKFREKQVLGHISAAKNAMEDEDAYQADYGSRYPEKVYAACYMEYQKLLKKNNALDFDDLLLKTVELFDQFPDILAYYQERFRYIMVDEYQDTNTVQFRLVSQLAGKYRNLCVVGDDDQSIYRFRGADIRNILSFEKKFPGARVIKLEQNYRSTKNILAAANEVIHHNRGRKDKTLWTANPEGDKIRFSMYDSAYDEAEGIARDVLVKLKKGAAYRDFAVLYRTNAQSRVLEEKFLAYNIPYRLVGGVNFYQRKEIKDVLCYLKTIANGADDVAAQRIINVPKRGIGQTTIGKAAVFAAANQMSFYEALEHADNIPSLGRAGAKIQSFTDEISSLREKAKTLSVRELIEAVLQDTGYREEIRAQEKTEEEAQARLDNIDELANKAVLYAENADEPTLDGFLADVALVADIDNLDDSENRVVLMTLHAAKGLEFPYVYMAGMEDGLFPGMQSIMSGDGADMEEERRLCYVGITRARKELRMTAARRRMIHGEWQTEAESRFVSEIPDKLLERDMQDSWSALARARSRENAPDFGEEPSDLSFSGGSQFSGGRNSFPGSSGTAGPGAGRTSRPRKPAAPTFGKEFRVEKAASVDFAPGDRVKHKRFGEGTVRSVEDGGKDFEITVEFDRFGVKKMFVSLARLEKA
ncbi:DNA helicase PcrA [Clostridium vitabionis]|uniref:DNA helicase PcrA n=1 Tax=Clostridium vitabionis TaxID=2784388 RepID=UPI00188A46EB|nr:DNA helicase PcrA [Clostridium vitabionis]